MRICKIISRSILLDHVFEDGNKRTATAVILLIMQLNKIESSAEEIPKIVVKITKNNIKSIRELERCIKDGIR